LLKKLIIWILRNMKERRVRKNSRRVSEKKIKGLVGWRKIITLLEGFQASPCRPADKVSVKVKMLGWLDVVA
jgi:hypothetical protein